MRLNRRGIWGPPKDRAVAVAVLRRAVGWESTPFDLLIPTVQCQRRVDRRSAGAFPNDLVIGTKGGWNPLGRTSGPHDAQPGAPCARRVEGSLKRLASTDHVYQPATFPDPVVPFDASIEPGKHAIRRKNPIGRAVMSMVEHMARAENHTDSVGPE